MPSHNFLQQLTILYTFVLLLVANGAPFESCAPQNSAPFLRDGHARPPGDGGTDTKASSTRPADVGQQLLESDVGPRPSTRPRDPLSRASPSGTRSRSGGAPLPPPAPSRAA